MNGLNGEILNFAGAVSVFAVINFGLHLMLLQPK